MPVRQGWQTRAGADESLLTARGRHVRPARGGLGFLELPGELPYSELDLYRGQGVAARSFAWLTGAHTSHTHTHTQRERGAHGHTRDAQGQARTGTRTRIAIRLMARTVFSLYGGAWAGPGVYHGALVFSNQNPGENVIDGAKLMPCVAALPRIHTDVPTGTATRHGRTMASSPRCPSLSPNPSHTDAHAHVVHTGTRRCRTSGRRPCRPRPCH
jgi:hypothetical protein